MATFSMQCSLSYCFPCVVAIQQDDRGLWMLCGQLERKADLAAAVATTDEEEELSLGYCYL